MKTPFDSKPAESRSLRTGLLLLCVLLAGLICNGCLTRPAIRQETFAFQCPPPKTGPLPGTVLSIGSVEVSALFNRQLFTYRTGPEAYETDSYAAFLASPGQTVASAIRAYLLGSGQFQDVTGPGSRVKPDKTLQVHVSEIYGDFSHAGKPAAVLSIRVTSFDEKSNQPVLLKDYSRHIPLKENTAAAVMAGWNTALEEIMTEVIADVAPAT
jgi:ABC-type uncharacterized transport system auxiliary subunit